MILSWDKLADEVGELQKLPPRRKKREKHRLIIVLNRKISAHRQKNTIELPVAVAVLAGTTRH